MELLWGVMIELQPRLPKGRPSAEWWATVASTFNERSGLTVSGKACSVIASKCKKAGRPLPWEVARPVAAITLTATDVGVTLDDLLAEFNQFRREVVALLEQRLMPTPGVDVHPHQLWITCARLPETNNERLLMRVTSINESDQTVTLQEAGGFIRHTLPIQTLLRDFRHVGHATVSATPPTTLPSSTGTKLQQQQPAQRFDMSPVGDIATLLT